MPEITVVRLLPNEGDVTIMPSLTIRTVTKVWVGCDKGEENSVFAACPRGNGDVEIYAYVGCSDDCGYHEFDSRADAIGFARSTKGIGTIDIADDWVRIETIDNRAFNG